MGEDAGHQKPSRSRWSRDCAAAAVRRSHPSCISGDDVSAITSWSLYGDAAKALYFVWCIPYDGLVPLLCWSQWGIHPVSARTMMWTDTSAFWKWSGLANGDGRDGNVTQTRRGRASGRPRVRDSGDHRGCWWIAGVDRGGRDHRAHPADDSSADPRARGPRLHPATAVPQVRVGADTDQAGRERHSAHRHVVTAAPRRRRAGNW